MPLRQSVSWRIIVPALETNAQALCYYWHRRLY